MVSLGTLPVCYLSSHKLTWHSAASGASSDSFPALASSFLSWRPDWSHPKQRYSACLWSFPHFPWTQKHSGKFSGPVFKILNRSLMFLVERFWEWNANLQKTIHTKTSLIAALRAFSVSLTSRGLAMAAVLISCKWHKHRVTKVISCTTLTDAFSNLLHCKCTVILTKLLL